MESGIFKHLMALGSVFLGATAFVGYQQYDLAFGEQEVQDLQQVREVAAAFEDFLIVSTPRNSYKLSPRDLPNIKINGCHKISVRGQFSANNGYALAEVIKIEHVPDGYCPA